MTLEDDSEVANLVLWRDVFEKFRRAGRHSKMVLARGKLQREGAVVRYMVDLTADMKSLVTRSGDFH